MLTPETYVQKSGVACSKFMLSVTKGAYKDADKAVMSCLVNGCKALMVRHDMSFKNGTDKDILIYAINNFPFGSLLNGILTLYNSWVDAVRTKKKSFIVQLSDRLITELSEFVEYLDIYV